MQSTRSLSVALQVAPDALRILETELGISAQATLERALQESVDALVDAEGRSEQSEESPEICIYLTTDAEIRELNRAYRGVDSATDVLSFGYLPSPPVPLSHGVGEGANDAPSPTPWERGMGGEGAIETPLGDIIISVETALRQATPNGHDLLTELLMLALHGTLHLMGYDDSTETERATMNARAVSTLRRLGYAAREEWYSRYEDA